MENEITEITSREPMAHIAGRIVGMLVFLAGIAMLVFIFALAYKSFQNPDLILPITDLQRDPPLPASYFYARAVLLLILLFVMGFVSSLIAARGAQLFFTARRGEVRRATAD